MYFDECSNCPVAKQKRKILYINLKSYFLKIIIIMIGLRKVIRKKK